MQPARLEDPAFADAAWGRHIDRLTLSNYIREVEIGAFQEERGILQKLQFDLEVEVSGAGIPVHDDVDGILSYDTLVAAIDTALSAERLNLLETLGDKIACRILAQPMVQRLKLSIRKLDRGPFALGIEIERSRQMQRASPRLDHFPPPRIVHIENAVLEDPHLGAMIDEFLRDKRPTILTMGLPEHHARMPGRADTEARIALIAVEQNAWRLAEKDPRICVVETRTELVHGLNAGRLSVWAPAKIVSDSFADVTQAPAPGSALTQWFASYMSASEVLDLSGTMVAAAE